MPSRDKIYERLLLNESNRIFFVELLSCANHFHPDYFGKGKTWHDPKLDNVEIAYKFYKLVYEHSGREVINCTVGGNLDVFKRGKLEDYL